MIFQRKYFFIGIMKGGFEPFSISIFKYVKGDGVFLIDITLLNIRVCACVSKRLILGLKFKQLSDHLEKDLNKRGESNNGQNNNITHD